MIQRLVNPNEVPIDENFGSSPTINASQKALLKDPSTSAPTLPTSTTIELGGAPSNPLALLHEARPGVYEATEIIHIPFSVSLL